MSQRTSTLSRRRFLRHATAAAGGLLVLPLVSARNVLGANSRLNIAGIGAGGKGTHDLAGVAGENLVALCDVDSLRLDAALKKYSGARGYRDFRVLFDKEWKHIDAVTVSTPDHLHFHASMMAVQRKKHVYCQKPLTHTVWEARTLATAARRAGVATQMGNQGISAAQLRRDAELIRAGVIGEVREIHCWTDRPGKWWKQGLARPTEFPPVPSHLDWDLFVGPAPFRPYHPSWAQFLWRGWWDFGTGPIGDMGCHLLNLATLALDLRDPIRIAARSEGKNADCGPLWSEIVWDFPARGTQPAFKFFWYDGGRKPEPALAKREHRDEFPDNGVILVGTKDTFYAEGYNGGGRFLSGAKYDDFKHIPETFPKRRNWDQCHYDEWIEACKGGSKAYSNFDVAGPVSEIVLLGQLAVRMDQPLEWDAKKLKVTNVKEANRFVKTEYRKGWKL
jgi:predicted dehydrogenase